MFVGVGTSFVFRELAFVIHGVDYISVKLATYECSDLTECPAL